MSSTWTNAVRFAVAASLGLAACLIAWWPQSAAGSGGADLSPVVAVPTQNTPTPAPPTPTVAPPPPPTSAPPPAQPTHKATHKPKPTHKPTTLHNDGGSHATGQHTTTSSSHHASPPSNANGTGSTSAPYVPPTHGTAPPTKAPAPTKAATPAPTQSATTAPTPSTPTQTATAAADTGDPGGQTAVAYDTYLNSSEPVQATSAPVWVVPGILLVLTSMLAVLGGVLGRGNRSAVDPVRTPQDDALATDRA